MSTVILVRHGLTTMTGPVLAGRTPGLHLDERGEVQADALAQRLAAVPLTAVVSSPLDRCLDTASRLHQAQNAAGHAPQWHVEPRLIECDYGDWTGKGFKELAKDPAWKVVQTQPSAARFPGGERLEQVAMRSVAAIRDWDERLGTDAVWVACSHGDVIKAVLAAAYGMHLDLFQRIVVDPCSVSVVRFTDTRPYVLRANDTGGDLAPLAPPKRRRRGKGRPTVPTVGGGAGDGQL